MNEFAKNINILFWYSFKKLSMHKVASQEGKKIIILITVLERKLPFLIKGTII